MITELLSELTNRIEAFQAEAHQILSQHESSRKSRVITVDETRQKLTDLSIQQDELLLQSLTCVEFGLYRAACVMAWAAFMDFLERKIASDGLVKVKAIKSGWQSHNTVEELREAVTEYALIDAAKDLKLLSKAETKTIHGLLSKRNECAHPSTYNPGMNDSLGYIAELLKRIENLQGKTL